MKRTNKPYFLKWITIIIAIILIKNLVLADEGQRLQTFIEIGFKAGLGLIVLYVVQTVINLFTNK